MASTRSARITSTTQIHPSLERSRQHVPVRRYSGDQAELFDLIRQPGQSGRRVDGITCGVDDDQGPDGDTGLKHHRCGPDAALEHADACPGARTDRAYADVF